MDVVAERFEGKWYWSYALNSHTVLSGVAATFEEVTDAVLDAIAEAGGPKVPNPLTPLSGVRRKGMWHLKYLLDGKSQDFITSDLKDLFTLNPVFN